MACEMQAQPQTQHVTTRGTMAATPSTSASEAGENSTTHDADTNTSSTGVTTLQRTNVCQKNEIAGHDRKKRQLNKRAGEQRASPGRVVTVSAK
jgi:hypothetical protein